MAISGVASPETGAPALPSDVLLLRSNASRSTVLGPKSWPQPAKRIRSRVVSGVGCSARLHGRIPTREWGPCSALRCATSSIRCVSGSCSTFRRALFGSHPRKPGVPAWPSGGGICLELC